MPFFVYRKACKSTDLEAQAQTALSRKSGYSLQQITIVPKKPVIFFNACAQRTPHHDITITAFERSPDGGKGLARDTRVRWALEEVHQPYDVRLVSFKAMKEPAHLALRPFGQIPIHYFVRPFGSLKYSFSNKALVRSYSASYCLPVSSRNFFRLMSVSASASTWQRWNSWMRPLA